MARPKRSPAQFEATDPKDLLEGDYQRALLPFVTRNFPDHRFFRRNVGGVKLDANRFFKASISGQCDLYVIGRGGWHGEVELKRYGDLNDNQKHWRDWCAMWQVPWLVLEVHRGEMPATTIHRWAEELRAWLK